MVHQFITVNRAKIHYDAQGDGDAVVLIHSALGHLEMWDPQMAALAAHHHVMRYDVRGWGRSDGPLDDYADYEDLAALLQAVGIQRTALVGSSSGGGIAIDFALAFPQAVSALVLVAPAVGGYELTPDPFMANRRKASYDAYNQGDKPMAAEITAEVWVEGPGRKAADVDPLVRKKAVEMIRFTYELPDREAHPQRLVPPAVERLASIDAPTLLIVGDQDVGPMLTTIDMLDRKIRNARRATIGGTAHLPNMEKPEEFNRLVLEFLGQSGAKAKRS